MQGGGENKLGVGGVLILAAIGIFALFVAFVGLPMISRLSGISDEYMTYAAAGMAFAIAIVATLWSKYLNKRAAEDKN
jgi:hypothetical protein